MEIQKVRIPSNGQEMDGTLVRPEIHRETYPAVLLIHGMTSSKNRYVKIAEMLAAKRIIALAISLRGHGESDGTRESLTIGDGVKDGIAAYDFLVSQDGVDKTRIGVCGASFGGAIAALLSKERKIESLALRVPATYTDEMMNMTDEEVINVEKKVFNDMEIDEIMATPPIRALENFTGNLLVITSENDVIIPPKMTQAFLDGAIHALEKEQMMIEGATHDLSDENLRQQFVDNVVAFFVRTL